MNKTIALIVSFLTLTLMIQSSIFKSKAIAQTSERANNEFLERGKIQISRENLYVEVKNDRQWAEKEMGFFDEDNSYRMKIETLQTLTLNEENLMNELSADGIKLVEF